ncbi:hypothetical protein CYY_008473 [Polysphondylium violaceum]|uniref:Ankyrin repeat-containing protein n=1 Tax=Polysphondylium violaceum TaxID=133409 RepID=A0A8J4PLM7_9MYCE|nr:hypothetical protein CYY_008473 [Polysphondylium violaceum]
MNNSILYKLIFNNLFLSKKIFYYLGQRPCVDGFYYKYDDIVDVGWMVRNGHLGLIRDKLRNKNSNVHLYVDMEDLFSIIANKDTELFVGLFEKYKYYALQYYSRTIGRIPFSTTILDGGRRQEDKDLQLRNIQVIQYLFAHGHAIDLEYVKIWNLEIGTVKWLLESGWYKPTGRVFLNATVGLSPYWGAKEAICIDPQVYELKTEWSQEMFHLVLQYMDLPIPTKDAKLIIESNLYYPTPSVFESLLSLFDPDVKKEIFCNKLTYTQAIDQIYRQQQEYSRVTKKLNDRFSLIVDYPDQCDQVYAMWQPFIDNQENSFLALWKRYSHQISVSVDKILFNMNGVDIDIGVFILEVCFYQGNIKVLEFIHDTGYTIDNTNKHGHRNLLNDNFYSMLSKLTSDQDRATILKLSNLQGLGLKTNILMACCRCGHAENYNYYLFLFKDTLHIGPFLLDFLKTALKHKQYHMIKVIGYVGCNNLVFQEFSFKHFLDRVQELVQSTPVEQRDDLYQGLLSIAIKHKDMVSMKYIFQHYRIGSYDLNSVLSELALSPCLSMVDYIHRNQSLCFTNTSTAEFRESFFYKIFELSRININLPLVEYLIVSNCIDIKNRYNMIASNNNNNSSNRRNLYTSCNSNVNKTFKWLEMIYFYFNSDKKKIPKYPNTSFPILVFLIENLNYNRINAFIDILINDDSNQMKLNLLEYIEKNIDKFKSLTSSLSSSSCFQSLFDKIIVEKEHRLTDYKTILSVLVNRYKCNYQHLVNYEHGISSLFVSNK